MYHEPPPVIQAGAAFGAVPVPHPLQSPRPEHVLPSRQGPLHGGLDPTLVVVVVELPSDDVREHREVGEDAAGDAGLRRRGGAVPSVKGDPCGEGMPLNKVNGRGGEDVPEVVEPHAVAPLPASVRELGRIEEGSEVVLEEGRDAIYCT